MWTYSIGSVNEHLTLYVTYLYHVITMKWKRFFWKPEQNPKKIQKHSWNGRKAEITGENNFLKKGPLKQHIIPPRLIFKHWHKIRRIHEFILTEITDLITGTGLLKFTRPRLTSLSDPLVHSNFQLWTIQITILMNNMNVILVWIAADIAEKGNLIGRVKNWPECLWGYFDTKEN